ncbi:MAG: TatD family hydrolase [Candidatus Woesearchaeota archaeon]|nr:MAG: TatD family hydrolase [Candidatus Woesearchaeota archaeon]
MFIDVHAHMDIEEYMNKKIDIECIVKKCEEKNIVAVITQGVDIESNRKALQLSSKYKIIKAALGIYPVHCYEMIVNGKQKEFDEELSFIDKNLKEKKAIAIGEVGLDYKEIEPTEENKKIMKDCLKKFINIAKKNDVPIIIHSRKAELEIIELLEQEEMKNRKVIMHCFSGRKHLVERVRKNGWFLSIPATIVKTEHFQYIARDVPLSQLLTETDSPYLSPEPKNVNDPSNVIISIKKIAQIKDMDEKEVTNIIFNNYQKLFY